MDAIESEKGIGAERMVNEVIRTHPATIAVFNRFGIDTCCGGAAPIDEAAMRDGADPETLLTALNEVVGRTG
jgi:regulator of cell morphogenesis and NO signaling